MAKDKGKGAKGSTKKQPINWAKIAIPLLMVFIMVGSIFAFVLTRPMSTTTDNSNIKKSFDGLTDALALLPSNASFVRYADLAADPQLNETMYKYYWNTIPPYRIFSAYPKKDAVAVYPMEYFGNNTQNVVSLTDFGSAKINKSYTAYTIYGQSVLMANQYYYFTPETFPVVSGGGENVAYTLQVILGNNTSSYGTYADLFAKLKAKQIPIDNMTLETAGKDAYLPVENLSSLSYYAGIGPIKSNATANASEQQYNYVVIMHLNRSMDDSSYEMMRSIAGGNLLSGFHKYNIQRYDDYFVIEGQASMSICLEDMVNWGFMKYRAGTNSTGT